MSRAAASAAVASFGDSVVGIAFQACDEENAFILNAVLCDLDSIHPHPDLRSRSTDISLAVTYLTYLLANLSIANIKYS